MKSCEDVGLIKMRLLVAPKNQVYFTTTGSNRHQLAALRIQDVIPDPVSEFFHHASRIQGEKDPGSQILVRIKEF
jgi:hypothetical protein